MLASQNQDRQFKDLLKVLIDHGYEGMLEVFQTLLNEAAKIERSEALRAAPYERVQERTGYANGFKDKTIHTRMGAVKLVRTFPIVGYSSRGVVGKCLFCFLTQAIVFLCKFFKKMDFSTSPIVIIKETSRSCKN